MQDWNVVATTREHGFKQARTFLMPFGAVHTTGFYNVLTLSVGSVDVFLEQLREAAEQEPRYLDWIARVVPATATFDFQNPEEFEEKARVSVAPWAAQLAGRSFHVRMHRRGFKGRISSQDEERFLDECIIVRSAEHGEPARVSFEDPDFIVAVETVAQRAGLSLWSRDTLKRYPFLRLD